MRISRIIVGVLALFALGTAPVSAQEAPPKAPANDSTAPLRVFIDCGYCDIDFIRTEMPWLDYMRDRADAQVHVLVTQEGTGGGGSKFTLNFIGLREFATVTDTLIYNASSDNSQDATRRGLARMIQVGVTPYLARTPHASRLRITMAPPGGPAGGGAAVPRHDPWNFWTFRIGFNGSGNGESNSESKNFSGSVNASRTTEQWKTSVGVSTSQSLQSFTFPISATRDTTQTFFSRSAGANGSLVKSLGEQFSAGLTGGISTSTFGNTKTSISLRPAVEYDFFPYKESNRRMLTAQYGIGVRAFTYRDTTIYLQTKETLPQHSLSLSYNTQEPWGSVNLYASYSQYLHDTQFFNTGIGGGTDVRLFKGFSLNVFGDYSMVRDQLSLKKGSASQADILLRQRELATNFRYFVQMGVSYRFGSIFNNVVNPRMGGGGDGGGRVMFF